MEIRVTVEVLDPEQFGVPAVFRATVTLPARDAIVRGLGDDPAGTLVGVLEGSLRSMGSLILRR